MRKKKDIAVAEQESALIPVISIDGIANLDLSCRNGQKILEAILNGRRIRSFDAFLDRMEMVLDSGDKVYIHKLGVAQNHAS